MHQIIPRSIYQEACKRLQNFPALALLGARQVGKSTLAREILKQYPNSIYLDLELLSDRRKLEHDPEQYLEIHKDKLLCFDEIQRFPELFPTLRSLIDRDRRAGRYLILGSASRDLIQQSSESLAGRITYLEITPFLRDEVKDTVDLHSLWLRGGYPDALLAHDDDISMQWRIDYIRSFLERDLPQLGFDISSIVLRNFLQMCAHQHGQLLNASRLAASLGVSSPTLIRYIEIMEQTFQIRRLTPYFNNERKRVVKSPKIFFRDTGLLHALLQIDSLDALFGHPIAGSSFESLIIENLIHRYPQHTPYFYRDAKGNELDLILTRGQEKIAFEIKLSKAPQLSAGFYKALEYVQPNKSYVVAPVNERYPISTNIEVVHLDDLFIPKSSN